MDFKQKEDGFSLLEVILALTIIGIISVSIYNVNLAFWRFWNYNQDKVDIKQQGRVISNYLEKDIRRAIDVDVTDIDSDGESELLLNLGDNGGSDDETDEFTDYYLLYTVVNNKLTLKKPKSSFNDSGVSYPDWPTNSQWGNNRSITMEIINDHQFTFDSNTGLVSFSFDLVNNNESYHVEGKIHPRVLK